MLTVTEKFPAVLDVQDTHAAVLVDPLMIKGRLRCSARPAAPHAWRSCQPTDVMFHAIKAPFFNVLTIFRTLAVVELGLLTFE